MGKHEQIPGLGNEQEKSWLQKRAREAFIVFSLGVGGVLLKDSEEVPAAPEEDPIHLEFDSNVQEKFEIKTSIEGERYIVHIGQIHPSGDLQEMLNAPPARTFNIENQKDVEQAILFLQKKYGVKKVFFEGLTAHAANNLNAMFEETKVMRAWLAAGDFGRAVGWLNQLINAIGSTEYQKLASDIQASDKYYLLCRLNDFFEAIGEKSNILAPNEESFLKSTRENLKRFPLIEGDNAYLIGAPKKLLHEGKISLAATEDEQVYAPVEQAHNQLVASWNVGGEKKQEALRAFIQTQNAREDFVLTQMTAQGEEAQPVQVVVFGNGHDFSANTKRIRAAGGAHAHLGLIKLESKAVNSLLASTQDPGPNFVDTTDK